MKKPNFMQMVRNYPSGTIQQVKSKIGGKVNSSWIKNSCAIRMSRALNYTGIELPSKSPGLLTVKGGDGLNYALRIKELSKYLRKIFGPPILIRKLGSDISIERIIDKMGIIIIHHNFSNARGHTTLWYKEICADGTEYYKDAYMIEFWTMP